MKSNFLVAWIRRQTLSDGSPIYRVVLEPTDRAMTFYIDTIDLHAAETILRLVKSGDIVDIYGVA